MESENRTVTLDVREDLKRGREPFSKIMAAVANLSGDEELLLIAPFEPAPLYAVLAAQGFAAEPSILDSGDYAVRFTRSGGRPSAAPLPRPTPHACQGQPVIEVDARGLEPPQPLVKILESLTSLPAGAHLRAFTDRRPMHLYPQLIERGYSGQTEEQSDGSFVTYVRPL